MSRPLVFASQYQLGIEEGEACLAPTRTLLVFILGNTSSRVADEELDDSLADFEGA
jgi:hypothetical protein